MDVEGRRQRRSKGTFPQGPRVRENGASPRGAALPGKQVAELQILNGSLQWRTVKVEGPRFLIGRRESCNLVLQDGRVSREHTVLLQSEPGRYKAKDLQSENGSYVNGRRITESPLQHMDLLRVGRTEMRFLATRTPGETGGESAAGEKPGRDLKSLHRELRSAEERLAALIAENAVLRRALQRAGVSLPDDGSPEAAGLPALPGPTPRLCWPGPRGGTLVSGPEASGTATTALRLDLVGVGPTGARLAEAAYSLGRRRTLAMLAPTEGQASLELPPAHLLELASPGDTPQDWPARTRDAWEAAAARVLYARPDVRLVACAPDELPDLARILTLLDPGCGAEGVRLGILGILSRASGPQGTEGLKPLLELVGSRRLGPLVLCEEARLGKLTPEGEGQPPGVLPVVLLDLLDRGLAASRAPSETPAAWPGAGLATLGVAGTESGDPASLEQALRHALGPGLLLGGLPEGGARRVALLALMGKRVASGHGGDVVRRVQSAAGTVKGILPRAAVQVGLVEDDGPGVRFVAYLSEQPLPESS